MSLKNLSQAADVQQEKDTLGGSYLIESGADTYTIELAYIGKSSGGATNVNLVLKNGNTTLRQTIYVTSKEGKTYSEKDGKKNNLPGFSLINNLCLLTLNKQLSDLDTEEKIVKLYDFDAKKEMPVAVEVITELLGMPVIAGVLKVIVDKTAKDSNNNYVPTGETREINEIDKFFRASDGMTSTEIKSGATEATFLNAWKEKNTGVTKNKAKGGTASGAKPGAPKATNKPTTSLFN